MNESGLEKITAEGSRHIQTISKSWRNDIYKVPVSVYGQEDADISTLMDGLFPSISQINGEYFFSAESASLQFVPEHWMSAYPASPENLQLMAILVIMPDVSDFQEMLQHMEHVFQYTPFLLISLPKNAREKIGSGGFRSVTGNSLNYVMHEWKGDFPESIENIVIANASPEHLDWYTDHHAIISIEDAKSTILQLLEKEFSNLRAKRQLNQQQLTRLKMDDNRSINELSSLTKGNLQNIFGTFEKGFNDRFERAFKGSESRFKKLLSDLLKKENILAEDHLSKSTITRFSNDYEEYFWNSVREYLSSHGLEDLKSLKDMNELCAADVEKMFIEKGMDSFSLKINYATPDRLGDIIKQAAIPDKQFSVERPRKGGYEYFMAARKYQMLVMILFSSLGLSFVRNIRLYMIPLTVFLIGYGFINVRRTVLKEREEEEVKMHEKAKDYLNQEVKRAVNDFGRSWSKYISDFLKQQQDTILQQIELSLRQHQKSVTLKEEELRNKFQRIHAGMETQDRMIENLKRRIAGWERTAGRTQSELRNSFTQFIRNK
jgi:hypothetical protein